MKTEKEDVRSKMSDVGSIAANLRRSHLRDVAIGAGALAAGGGVGYAGLRIARAANAVAKTAEESRKAARNARRVTARAARIGGRIERASRFIKRQLTTFPSFAKLGKVRLESRHFATIELAEKKKRGLPAEIKAGLSAGASGAVVGAGLPLIKRGTTIRQILKSAAIGGGGTAALIGGGAAIGSKILGRPEKKDSTAFTKRAAVGAGIAGAVGGGVAGLVAHKYKPLRIALKRAAKTNRPAHWIVKSGTAGAAGIGTLAGGMYGAAQGADEGMQVDTINNLKKQKHRKMFNGGYGMRNLSVRLRRTMEFAIGYEAGIPLTGKVARDRYIKKIRDEDLDRRDANILRASAAGAAAGLLARGKLSALRRAAVGATAGGAGVLVIRKATEGSRDPYGERSREAKRAENLPAVAGLGAAGLLALRRTRKNLRFSATLRLMEFGKKDQPRYAGSQQYADPLRAYGNASHLVDAEGNRTRLTQSQLVGAAVRKGRELRKYTTRTGNFVRDVRDVAAGRPRSDGRKREWEKSWFRNTVLTGGGAAAVLAHAVARRKIPTYRAQTDAVEKAVKSHIQKIRKKVDAGLGLAATLESEIFFARLEKTILLDTLANRAGWDVRDPRGKSARVFAPGSQRRQRRQKQWHEKVNNQRAILGGLAVAGTLAGAIAGTALGKRLAAAKRILPGKPIRTRKTSAIFGGKKWRQVAREKGLEDYYQS